jgi:hypothetical protein
MASPAAASKFDQRRILKATADRAAGEVTSEVTSKVTSEVTSEVGGVTNEGGLSTNLYMLIS